MNDSDRTQQSVTVGKKVNLLWFKTFAWWFNIIILYDNKKTISRVTHISSVLTARHPRKDGKVNRPFGKRQFVALASNSVASAIFETQQNPALY